MRRSLKTFNNLENSLTRIPLSFKSRLIELIVHECQKICKLTCGILQNLPSNVVCVLNHTPTSQPLFPPVHSRRPQRILHAIFASTRHFTFDSVQRGEHTGRKCGPLFCGGWGQIQLHDAVRKGSCRVGKLGVQKHRSDQQLEVPRYVVSANDCR